MITEATDLAFDVFRERYVGRMSWSPEQFQERVTKGCFPLHPLTTAVISDIELEASSNPRSILGFVFDALESQASLDVVEEGAVNWILPIALVDYFKEMLRPRLCKVRECSARGGPRPTSRESQDLEGYASPNRFRDANCSGRGVCPCCCGNGGGSDFHSKRRVEEVEYCRVTFGLIPTRRRTAFIRRTKAHIRSSGGSLSSSTGTRSQPRR